MRSMPVISNVTMIGAPDAPQGDVGILLRRGTGAELWSTAVTNFSACLDIDDDETFDTASDGGIKFKNTFLSCFETTELGLLGRAFDDKAEDPFGISVWFFESNANAGNAVVVDPGIIDAAVGRPNFALSASSTVGGTTDTPADPFFTAVDFAGAVSSSVSTSAGAGDWTRTGWTSIEPDTGLIGNGSSDIPAGSGILCASGTCIVPTGTYLEDMTWGPDNEFVVTGPSDAIDHVVIGDGSDENAATLTVLPGTVVRAFGGTAIVIAPGSRIVADGADSDGNLVAPIVFTSLSNTPRRGDWGG